jgi:hypothetical protein
MVNVKIVERKPEPPIGQVLTITNVESIKTTKGDGIRVTFQDSYNNEYNTMLWVKEQVGSKSKLGAFITTLGLNENEWVGKKIKIVAWGKADRQIELAETNKKSK